MSKKFFIFFIVILLSSCSKQIHTNVDEKITNEEQDIKEEDNINKDDTNKEDTANEEKPRYTGELITDGIYGDNGYFYFVPDKETKELIDINFSIYYEESLTLCYDEKEIIKDLPTELGIYKVEINPIFDDEKRFINISSIKLTDKIGTIEYEGKTYDTNNLDENVRVKDRVCGLIVENVSIDKDYDSARIYFAGEIEVEGIYNVFPGGEYYNNIKMGKILIDETSMKNFPTYKDYSKPTVAFKETNDLYKKLSDNSVLGKGKFKVSNYHIIYNIGTDYIPFQKLTEIISLDETYKELIKFDENPKIIYGITNKYILVFEHPYTIETFGKGNYYLVDRKNYSVIKILSTNGFHYKYEESSDDRYSEEEMFTLTSDGRNDLSQTTESEHTITFRLNNGVVFKELSYAVFKIEEGTKTIYEGQEFLGMKAEDIRVLYYCFKDKPEELVRIQVQFSGETTVTGKLLVSNSDLGYRASFYCDEKSVKNLPYPSSDTRSVWFIITNENVQDILSTEQLEKDCKLTIKNYYIHFAATEAANTAEIVKIEEITE